MTFIFTNEEKFLFRIRLVRVALDEREPPENVDDEGVNTRTLSVSLVLASGRATTCSDVGAVLCANRVS